MCRGRDWVTDDPLGLGGLLTDAYKLAQLMVYHDLRQCELPLPLLDDLLAAALAGMVGFQRDPYVEETAPFRLAFRELGLAIGLRALQGLEDLLARHAPLFADATSVPAHVNALLPYLPVGAAIEEFWMVPHHRNNPTWIGHRDINMVMLATSLAPEGYLTLARTGNIPQQGATAAE
jgi:hypothetical protein